MFDKGSGFQALVQMSDVYSAMAAHEAADMQVGISQWCGVQSPSPESHEVHFSVADSNLEISDHWTQRDAQKES